VCVFDCACVCLCVGVCLCVVCMCVRALRLTVSMCSVRTSRDRKWKYVGAEHFFLVFWCPVHSVIVQQQQLRTHYPVSSQCVFKHVQPHVVVCACGIAGLCEVVPDFEGIEEQSFFVSVRSLPKALSLEDQERGNDLRTSSPETT
jgi:hypothetical protein